MNFPKTPSKNMAQMQPEQPVILCQWDVVSNFVAASVSCRLTVNFIFIELINGIIASCNDEAATFSVITGIIKLSLQWVENEPHKVPLDLVWDSTCFFEWAVEKCPVGILLWERGRSNSWGRAVDYFLSLHPHTHRNTTALQSLHIFSFTPSKHSTIVNTTTSVKQHQNQR